MNEALNWNLKNALLDQLGLSECVLSDILQETHYVLDGESSLQRLPQTVGSTLDEICKYFKNYLFSNYGTTENITVVFDGGYQLPSAKYGTYIRRSKEWLRRKIVSSLHNPFTVKKK